MESIRHRMQGTAVKRSSLADELGLSHASQFANPHQTAFKTKLAAELWINIGGKDFRLVGKTIRIGRAEDNDIILEHKSVSRYHAMITVHQDQIVFEDMKSRNGVRVKGAQVRRAELKDNDEISIGDLQGVFFQRFKKHSVKRGSASDSKENLLNHLMDKIPVVSFIETFQELDSRRKKIVIGSVVFGLLAILLMFAKPHESELAYRQLAPSGELAPELRPSDKRSFERCMEAEDLGNFRQAGACYKNLAQTPEVQIAIERLKKRQADISERRYKEGKQAFENYYYDMAILKFQEVLLVSDDESEYRTQAVRGIQDAEEKKKKQ